MKKLVLLVALLLASITLQAGELVFHWNKMAESKIYDMEFMPDNDYFVVVLSNEFQVRRTEDGEIVNTYKKNESLSFHDIEFTPDSSKLIVAYDSIIEIRSVKDFSILNTYTLPADSEDYTQYIMEIKVDPIRPYIYVVLNKQKYVNSSKIFKRQILIINNENLKDEGKITKSEDENLYLQNLALSSDGKYMTVSNEGGSKLIVWSLETQKKVNEYWLCPPYHGVEIWGLPTCIKFSELNSDKIYISGEFPQDISEPASHYGLFIYSITENKIIDSTFGFGSEKVYPGYFTFIEKKDERIVYTNKLQLFVINLLKSLKEITSETYYISKQILYSKSKELILGRGEQHITKLTYKNGSGLKNESEIYKTIYPNPTTGTIRIELNCSGSTNYYEIFDSTGLLLKSKIIENIKSIFQLDLSNYSNSIYFIKIYCGSDVQTFKIIKEN